MKRPLFLLALLFTCAATRADLVLEQKMESAVQNGNMIMKIKGEKVRVDMPAGPAGAISSIVDVASGDSTMLMHSQKMMMKVSGAQTQQMLDLMKKQMTTPGGKAEAPKLQPTGKKEKVGDYDTEVYTWMNNGIMQTMWISKGFPNYAGIKPQLDKLNQIAAKMAPGFSPDLGALPGMVVKTEVETAGQKITTTLVSLKDEPLDAALFVAPPDYKAMATPGLPK